MQGLFRLLLISVLTFFITASQAYCDDAWINDLRSLYLSNSAIIYGINIRTFGAKDINNNGIIEFALGEESGTFLNALPKIKELAGQGVNTIHLFPITSVGRTKALGTAGSLYSPSSFTEINPQLKSPDSKLCINDEVKKFIDECHRLHLRVIVDLPSCASYDLYMKRPELFLVDKNNKPVIPTDWTDVRVLDAGSETNINTDVYNMYHDFIELIQSLGADGVRVDLASIKPYSFWKKLIDESRAVDPQILFLAQASKNDKSPSQYVGFTPFNKILDAGFDGYYGGYSEISTWKSAKDLYSSVNDDLNISKKYSGQRRVIGNFATPDRVSPVLMNGPLLSQMIVWLNATLPLNSYYIDGFSTGDTYLYPWANKKAALTYTDDEYYFVHRGQLDIFNFSRAPMGKNGEIFQSFLLANKLKIMFHDIISNGNFVTFRTTSPSVFAYGRSLNKKSLIVIGNLDFKTQQKVTVYIPKLSVGLLTVPLKLTSVPKVTNGKINLNLNPGDVVVLYVESLELK